MPPGTVRSKIIALHCAGPGFADVEIKGFLAVIHAYTGIHRFKHLPDRVPYYLFVIHHNNGSAALVPGSAAPPRQRILWKRKIKMKRAALARFRLDINAPPMT